MVKYTIALNPKMKYQPEAVIKIHSYYPFTYAVTLTAVINDTHKQIRRWDNVGKKDHIDIFHGTGKITKHVRSKFEIKNMEQLGKLYENVKKHHLSFIVKFEGEYKWANGIL